MLEEGNLVRVKGPKSWTWHMGGGMDATIGQIGVIMNAESGFDSYGVDFPGTGLPTPEGEDNLWWYEEAEFEKVDDTD